MTPAERFYAEERVEQIKTTEEVFEAGFRAGHDACYPPMGPGRTVQTVPAKAYEQFLEDQLR